MKMEMKMTQMRTMMKKKKIMMMKKRKVAQLMVTQEREGTKKTMKKMRKMKKLPSLLLKGGNEQRVFKYESYSVKLLTLLSAQLFYYNSAPIIQWGQQLLQINVFAVFLINY